MNRKKEHLDITGIGAAACRHECFIPGTVVNFQKGERQMNMDYCVSQVFKTLPALLLFLVLYDIACQYGINMKKRFGQSLRRNL